MRIPDKFICRISLLVILLTAGAVGPAAGPARADIYAWTDADGILHYSNHDPPAEARFHMAEYVPAPDTASPQENRDANETPDDDLKARLDAANRKLDATLDQVDDLTRQVAETRREATAAAEAARLAAAQAATASEARTEKTVVFGLPYRRPDRPSRPVPYYWNLDTTRYPYYREVRERPQRHDPPSASRVSVDIRRSGGTLTGRESSGR